MSVADLMAENSPQDTFQLVSSRLLWWTLFSPLVSEYWFGMCSLTEFLNWALVPLFYTAVEKRSAMVSNLPGKGIFSKCQTVFSLSKINNGLFCRLFSPVAVYTLQWTKAKMNQMPSSVFSFRFYLFIFGSCLYSYGVGQPERVI